MVRAPVPLKRLKEFEGVDFEEDYRSDRVVDVDILIGLDFYWDLKGTKQVRSEVGLVAQETKFSWMLSGVWTGGAKGGTTGKGCENVLTQSLNRALTSFCHCEIPEKLIQKMWDLESIGIWGKRGTCLLLNMKRPWNSLTRILSLKEVGLGQSSLEEQSIVDGK